MIKKIAIITGASSGFGAEYSRQIDKRFKYLDEIWLIARREDRLLQISKKLANCQAVILPYDLNQNKAFEEIRQKLQTGEYFIDILVNNAGFGRTSAFADEDFEYLSNMLDLNISAVVKLTHICLTYMGKKSKLINIASAAAFSPLPYFASYAATKSFVLNFTLSLSAELEERKIQTIAVCPGPCRTEFFNADDKILNSGLKIKTAKEVVNQTFKDLTKRKLLSITGLDIKLISILTKIIPLKIILKIGKRVKKS